MNRARVFLLLALMGAGSASSAWAAAGATGAASLKLSVGARGQGMGDAYAATVDGVESLFWNPAGLGAGAKRSLLLGFQPMLDNASLGQGAAAGRFGRLGLGIGFSGLNHDDLDGLDDVGNPTGSFQAQDQLFVVGAAISGPRANIGVAGKFFRSEIDGVSASAVAADIGVDFSCPLFKRIRHALVVRHLGGKISYVSQEDPLPTTAVLGTSFNSGKRVLVEGDAAWERDRGVYFSGGFEYSVVKSPSANLALRGGYSTRRNEAEGLSGASFGLGLAVKSISFDYAWVPFGELGDAHAITLIWRPSMEPRVRSKSSRNAATSTKDKIAPSQKRRNQLEDLAPPRPKR